VTSADKLGMVVAISVVIIFVGIGVGMSGVPQETPRPGMEQQAIVSDSLKSESPSAKKIIPDWVKTSALWYGEDSIPVDEFIESLNWLVSNDYLSVSGYVDPIIVDIPDDFKRLAFDFGTGKISSIKYLKTTDMLIEREKIVIVESSAILSDSFEMDDDVVRLVEGDAGIFFYEVDDELLRVHYADVIAVVNFAEGSGTPGCELTLEGCFPSLISSRSSMVVESGTTVLWANTDSVAHTTTSGNKTDGPDGIFDSSLIMSGDEFRFTFVNEDTFDYFCMIHPWMEGNVIVIPSIPVE